MNKGFILYMHEGASGILAKHSGLIWVLIGNNKNNIAIEIAIIILDFVSLKKFFIV